MIIDGATQPGYAGAPLIELNGAGAGVWQSLDLVQDPLDTTLWQGTLAAAELGGAAPADLRYLIQAVNGVGLVTMATNQGAYSRPDVDPAQPSPPDSDLATTTLALEPTNATVLPGADTSIVATLADASGKAILQKRIFFVVSSARVGTSRPSRPTIAAKRAWAP